MVLEVAVGGGLGCLGNAIGPAPLPYNYAGLNPSVHSLTGLGC